MVGLLMLVCLSGAGVWILTRFPGSAVARLVMGALLGPVSALVILTGLVDLVPDDLEGALALITVAIAIVLGGGLLLVHVANAPRQ